MYNRLIHLPQVKTGIDVSRLEDLAPISLLTPFAQRKIMDNLKREVVVDGADSVCVRFSDGHVVTFEEKVVYLHI